MNHRLASIGTGIVVASGIGLIAASLRDSHFWLTFVVFAACTSPPSYLLGWLLFSPEVRENEAPGERPDNIEFSWLQRAGKSALFDLIALTGIVATVLAVSNLDPSAVLILAALTIIGMSDLALRLTLLRRQET